MTTLSPRLVSLPCQTRHSAPMGVFSVHRKRMDGAADEHVPSTPVKTAKYTATTDTPPSSSRLASRAPTPVPACPPPALASQPTSSSIVSPTPAVNSVQTSTSKHSLAARNARSHSPTLQSTYDYSPHRLPPSPRLPDEWNGVHDHAMCVLDTCNYSPNAIIKKLRSAFPELAKSPLTQVMIDKRLRVLDQNPEIDYFRTGVEHADREAMERARLGKAVSTDTGGPSGYDTRIPADPRVSTLTAPTSTINSSLMSIPSLPDLPERLKSNHRESGNSVKTMTTEPVDTGFHSHMAPTLVKDMNDM